MQFTSFYDFLTHIATGPGFVLNWVLHGLYLIFVALPVFLWWAGVSLVKFLFFLPVFIYKSLIWLLTLLGNFVELLYGYFFERVWTWSDLGIFPAIRPEVRIELLREGIDRPFGRFAGDISEWLKEAVSPLILAMEWITDQLQEIPWIFLFPAIIVLVWVTSKSRGVTVLAVFALLYLGLFEMVGAPIGSFDVDVGRAYQTISLMIVSIALCVVVGVPLGILMSSSNMLEAMIKPVLDVMQTMPSFVYLIPVLILFGVSEVAGLIAVTIYAMPPVIRLTNLGIRLVAFDVIEAANAFGATYRQRLTGVLIPLALPNIFAGINQTIMMALAMVVIAAFVGANGIGQLVLSAQSNTNFGLGLLYGFAIVLIAIVIDRTFHSVGERMQEHRRVGH